MTQPIAPSLPSQIDQAARVDPALALELALRWTQEEPSQPRAWSKLAHIHELARRRPEAAQAARAAAGLAPGAPDIWFKLGRALCLAQDPQAASEAFARCESLGELSGDPFYTDSARVARARCLLELGRPREAMAPLLAASPRSAVWLGSRLTAESLLAQARASLAP